MRKIVAFPSSVVYYFRDLLKSANRTFVRNKKVFGLWFDCLSSTLLILRDFKVTRCLLVDIITSPSVPQLRLLQTRNFALSLMNKYKYRLHLLLFSLNVMAFPACTCETVDIRHSFEFFCKRESNTGSYVSSFYFICIFILFLTSSHMYVFLFLQCVPLDVEVGYEKSRASLISFLLPSF